LTSFLGLYVPPFFMSNTIQIRTKTQISGQWPNISVTKDPDTEL
jgi:hypothetical protein